MLLLGALPGIGAMRTLTLNPGSAQVAFRAYGLGFVPIDGAFTRFSGTLAIDSADPAICTIDVQADAASLQMSNADMTKDALGADMLDVARFPAFAFNGRCQGSQVHGTLLLHGVSRPLAFDISIERQRWVATAKMRRADWGMGARPLVAGPEVRLRFTAALPPDLAANLASGFSATR